MVGLENYIRVFTDEFLKDSEYFVVDIVRGSSNKMTKISVFLDSDTSVAIEKCAEVSRRVTARVDEELNFEDPYIIEVSSAGLDKPLLQHRQYIKNIGRNVELVLMEGRKVQGKLIKAEDDKIVIMTEKTKKSPEEELVFDKKDIKSTIVLISF